MKKLFTLLFVVLLGTSACSQESKDKEDVKNEEKAVSEKALKQKGEAKEKDMTGVSTTVEIDPDADFFDQLTYLSAEFDNSDCKMISLMVADDNYDYSPSLLEEPKVIDELGEDFVLMLKGEIEAAGYTMLSEYCKTDNHTYVTVSDSANYDSVKILVQAPEPGFIELAEIDGLMDFYYAFQPEAEIVDGDHLVRTGYGDAGSLWWDYYRVDAETGDTELIEKCTGGPEDYNDDQNHNFVYGCDLKFEPEA